MGLPKLPFCAGAGALLPPKIRPAAWSLGTEPSVLEVWGGEWGAQNSAASSQTIWVIVRNNIIRLKVFLMLQKTGQISYCSAVAYIILPRPGGSELAAGAAATAADACFAISVGHRPPLATHLGGQSIRRCLPRTDRQSSARRQNL